MGIIQLGCERCRKVGVDVYDVSSLARMATFSKAQFFGLTKVIFVWLSILRRGVR